MIACLDYNGTFYILNKLKSKNPILKHNMQSIVTYKFNEIIKKFIQ